MSYRKKRNGKTLMTKFKLLLAALATMAAVVAAALWLAPLTPPVAQAQEATAFCDHDPLDARAQKAEHQPPEERHPAHPLHGRTQKVVDAILANLSETDCADVTIAQLNGLAGTLTVGDNLSSLQSVDFEHLSGLEQLNLFDNDLTELPSDVFDGLSSLTHLRLDGNDLSDLPEEVFDGLASLEILRLNGNSALGTLPPEVFDGLSSLEQLYLNGNTSLACIHPGQFDGLSALRELHLSNTKLGNIAPTPHASRWGLNNLQELNFGNTSITGSALGFQDYQAVFPALVESRTRVTSNAVLSDPICGSIVADAAGGNDGTVRVLLEGTRVRPNRASDGDASLGDGVCGSDTATTRHVLWTWQRSANGVDWNDMPQDRQPPDYGSQGRMDGECSFLYTPQSDDDGMYVRAYVLVDTAGVGANNYPTAAFGPLNVP